jgi:hypothetical protein
MVMATIAQMRAAARPGLDDITERGFEFDEVEHAEFVVAIFPVLKPKIPRVVPHLRLIIEGGFIGEDLGEWVHSQVVRISPSDLKSSRGSTGKNGSGGCRYRRWKAPTASACLTPSGSTPPSTRGPRIFSPGRRLSSHPRLMLEREPPSGIHHERSHPTEVKSPSPNGDTRKVKKRA